MEPIPHRFHGCDPCRRLEFDLTNALNERARVRRILRRGVKDNQVDRYAEEAKAAAAWVKRGMLAFEAHHADAHPVPAVVLPRTDNHRAPSHRKPKLPPAAELASMLRSGETLDQIAARFERSPEVISRKVSWAGFHPRTGVQRVRRHDDDGVSFLSHWHFPPWVDQALCAQVGGDIFFPEKGESTREAKAVCRACPVREPCLQWALDNNERFGVYGGLSERERRKLKDGGCTDCGAPRERGRKLCNPCRERRRREAIRRASLKRSAS